MFVLPTEVQLFEIQHQSLVRAQLVQLTRELAATEIDGAWWNIAVTKNARDAEGDHHWVWRTLVGQHRNDLTWEAVAVQSTSGAIEGASIYRIDAKSQIDKGEGAIFIDRLSTAPRNRPWLVDSQKYQGIGTILILTAVRHSYSLGLGGLVWLTSLPSENTRRFYRNRGFDVIFENEDGTIDFELNAAAAQRWLESEGDL